MNDNSGSCQPECLAGSFETLWREKAASPELPVSSIPLHASWREVDASEGIILNDSEWIDVARFFYSTYFQRLWPVQEIVLSRSATLWRGNYSVSWDVLTVICNIFTKFNKAGNELFHEVIMGGLLRASLISDLQQDLMRDAMQVLHTATAFDCKESRDKIYACLGLLNSKVRSIGLRRLLQGHGLAAEERDLLLLLHQELQRGLEDGPYGTAAEGHGDVLAVQLQAVDFPFFGAVVSRQYWGSEK